MSRTVSAWLYWRRSPDQPPAAVLEAGGERLADTASVVVVEIEHGTLLELEAVRHPARECGAMGEVARAHAEGIGSRVADLGSR